MAEVLKLQTAAERHATRVRRLKLAAYGLTLTGLAAGGWAVASGLRGRDIDDACASEESCSPSSARHGRMLYRSANAGAVIGTACGISAAVLLWRLLTEQPTDGLRGANVWPFVF